MCHVHIFHYSVLYDPVFEQDLSDLLVPGRPAPTLSPSKDNCILEMFPNELITSVPWGDLFNIGQDLEVADIYPRSSLLGSSRFTCCDASCHISILSHLLSSITGCFSNIIILKSSITPTPIQQKPPPLSIGLQPFWNILIP